MQIQLSCLLLLAYQITFSQSNLWKITEEDQHPLSFVNITIPAKQLVLFSNEKGEFELELNKLVSTDSVFISHIGFEDFKTTLSKLSENHTLVLHGKSYELKEVNIAPLDARGMVRLAVSKVPENYPTNFSETRFMFKDFSLINDEKTHFNFCDYNLFLSSYAGKSTHFSTINKSGFYKQKGKLFPELSPYQLNQLMKLQTLFSEKNLEHNNYYFAGSTNFEGKQMDVIQFTEIPTKKNDLLTTSGTIYIEQGNRAIRYVAYKAKSNHSKRFFLIANMDTMLIDFKIVFKPFEGKYVVDYISQKTYAEGTLFFSHKNLNFSSTCKAISQKLNISPTTIPAKDEVKDAFDKRKAENINKLGEEPE